jgi:hypothetical protein
LVPAEWDFQELEANPLDANTYPTEIGVIPPMPSIFDTPLAELEKAVGFDPNRLCMFCDEPVQSLSCGGPEICPACDCGHNKDGTEWTPQEAMKFYDNARRKQAKHKLES